MNARRKGDWLWRKLQHRLLKSPGWISDADLRGGDLLAEIKRHKNRGGARFSQLRRVAGIRVKTYISVFGFRERSDPGDFQFRIADQLSVAHLRELLESELHSGRATLTNRRF